jgi:hypothetical protein
MSIEKKEENILTFSLTINKNNSIYILEIKSECYLLLKYVRFENFQINSFFTSKGWKSMKLEEHFNLECVGDLPNRFPWLHS